MSSHNMFKRRRYEKTDYRQRLALLKSGKPRMVVRRTLNNIHIQLINYEAAGDKTVVDIISKNLIKYGWKAHGGNTSSSYLCGILAALEASKKGIDTAVVDMGLQISSNGSVLYAAMMGARDAGLKINLGSENLPDMKRISGAHVAEYAKKLKSDKQKYEKQFSAYIKAGLDPEKMVEHFEDVKKNILKEYGFTLVVSDVHIDKKPKKEKKEVKENKQSKKNKKEAKEAAAIVEENVAEGEKAAAADEEFVDVEGDEEFEDTA